MTNWFFRIFVFLLPVQLAYHLWPEWAFVFGIRVDYLSPTFYLTDILFLLVFILAVISKKISPKFRKPEALWTFGILTFVLINIAGAASPLPALFKWTKLLELYLVFLLAKNFKTLDFKDDFLKPLFISAAFFSGVGVLQFLKGGTLGGAFYFLGERRFSLFTHRIALVKVAGRDFLRAYSTFPHPNSFAGQMSLVLIFLLTAKKKVFAGETKFLISILVITGLLLSFSFGAWLALLGVAALFLVTKKRKVLFGRVGPLTLFFTIVFSLTFPLVFQGAAFPPLSESLEKRAELALVS